MQGTRDNFLSQRPDDKSLGNQSDHKVSEIEQITEDVKENEEQDGNFNWPEK